MNLHTLQLQSHAEGLHDAVEWHLPDWEQFVSGTMDSRRRDESDVLSESVCEECLACARRSQLVDAPLSKQNLRVLLQDTERDQQVIR